MCGTYMFSNFKTASCTIYLCSFRLGSARARYQIIDLSFCLLGPIQPLFKNLFPRPVQVHVQWLIKIIFHGVMVRIGKVKPKGWSVRSGPSFSEVQITGLPEGSTFPMLTNDPVIDYFSCLSTLIDHLTPQLNVFYTFMKNDVMLLCSVTT